jgi:hypothetical protein
MRERYTRELGSDGLVDHFVVDKTKVVASWEQEWEREAQFSKRFQERSVSGAFFYIIHILIYFGAYIYKKM